MPRMIIRYTAYAVLTLVFLGASGASAASCNLQWTDLSASIPSTILDTTTGYPLLSFAAGRGTDWLVGNPNQIFLVTSQGKIFDLTPDLKRYGFQKIRQVATDGQNWLVLGDSNPWFSQPDLALRYDGMYWQNVSSLMASLPPQEWVGPIAGKQGLWVIPTNHSLFLWQSSLQEIVNIPLPRDLMQSRRQAFNVYPLRTGWLIAAAIDEAKLYYFFDGQHFTNLKDVLGDINRSTQVASDGGQILLMTAISDPKRPQIHSLFYDGQKTRKLDSYFGSLIDWPTKNISFFPESNMVWDGESWLMADRSHHLACFDGRSSAVLLPPTRDFFITSAYGSKGLALHVGYNHDAKGGLMPRLVMTQE